MLHLAALKRYPIIILELYLNGTQIPIIGEANFLGLLFDSRLSFIPHHFLEEYMHKVAGSYKGFI